MPIDIAILLFDNLTALDAVGPYEVLRGLPDSELRFVAADPGVKRTDHGALAIQVEHSLTDAPAPDVIVVPGGPGEADARKDDRVLDWLRYSGWVAHECCGHHVESLLFIGLASDRFSSSRNRPRRG